MTTLWVLLGGTIIVGIVVGLLARLSGKELVAELLVMCALALAFYGLIAVAGVSQGG